MTTQRTSKLFQSYSFISFQINIINIWVMCESGWLTIFYHCCLCCLNVFRKMGLFLTRLSVWHNLVNTRIRLWYQLKLQETQEGGLNWVQIRHIFATKNKYKNNNNNYKDNDKRDKYFYPDSPLIRLPLVHSPEWFCLKKSLNPIVNLIIKQGHCVTDFLRIMTNPVP